MKHRNNPVALLTDGQERSTLAACRMLGEAGYDVAVAASEHPAPAQWSRFCTERLSVVDPRRDPARFVRELERITARQRYDALLPGSDATLFALACHGERLRGVRTGLPLPDTIKHALSKIAVSECASAIGHPAPRTVVCRAPGEALAAAETLGYPVVLKPRRSVFQYDGGLRQRASITVRDAATLKRLAKEFGVPCLVQRRQSGSVVSVGGVMAGGGLLAAVASRYGRTWHPDAGSASYSQTIPLTPALERTTSDFVANLGWEGIFELELLEGAEGEVFPIDFNPRAYGSLALAGAAGVPLATIWCDWLRGDPSPGGFAPTGFRYRWEDADLRNMWWLLSHRNVSEALAIARPRRRTVHAYLWMSDPLPAVARARLMGRHRWRKVRPPLPEPARDDRSTPAAGASRERQRGRPRGRGAGPGPRVVVIGAGPYGLSAAHFCRHAGAVVRSFGRPMEFWSEAMPAGMILRSRWRSSHIADPTHALSLDRYEREIGRLLPDHIAVADFIDYGRWYQERAVPDLDERLVERVERTPRGFELTLEDGDACEAENVIVATGLDVFAYRPPPFAGLPASLVSHTVEHRDLSAFAGKRVLVIGAGQSALESAALLHEVGAEAEVLARAESLAFLAPEEITGVVRRVNAAIVPPTDVGGRLTGWAAAAPDVYRRLPVGARSRIEARVLRPRGADWLRSRIADITITLGRRAISAYADGGDIRVTLDTGSQRLVDHVLLGTGYHIAVPSCSFLSRDLVSQVELREGHPALGRGLESSVPGLHFVGAPAAYSFGPIMRFVVGTWYAAPAVAEGVTGARGRPIRLAYRRRRPWHVPRHKRPALPPLTGDRRAPPRRANVGRSSTPGADVPARDVASR